MLGQTSNQMQQAKEIIKQTNIPEAQVREMAKSQGLPEKNINELFQKEKGPQGSFEDVETQSAEPMGQFEPTVDDNDLEIIDESTLDLEKKVQPYKGKLTYFGYDIFSRDPSIFQATSVGAADPDYLIGPGDEIIIMLWGETQFRQVLTVDREGFVFIPEIGQVFVNGLNLNLLESKLFRVFSQSYASLNPQGRTPTTFLDVSLGNLRPLRIQVLGEVAQPGAYTVSPSTTLFSSLYYFNGPTVLGSLRDIQLIRGGEQIATIDFYDYLLTGKKPKDQKLQLDDVIFIPRRLKSATIEGEINRSGIYELKPKESLTDFISIAGGLKITAYLNRAQIDRIVPFEDRKELGMDRLYNDVNLEEVLASEKPYLIQDGDHIQVFSVLDLRQNIVNLEGSVTRPGSYDLGESLKLSELINKADGTLGDAYMERVDIIRIKPDFTEELIKLNLGAALKGSLDNDIYLNGMDRIRVYSVTEMVPRTSVSIVGHVKEPGNYLLQQNMTLYDLIFKAGGFIDEEYKKQTFLERADLIRLNDDNVSRSINSFNLGNLLESPNSELDLPLKANDIIRIYDKDIFLNDKPITINGVVRNPGSYSLKIDMSLKDLILEAGGLNENIYRYRVEVARIDPYNSNLDDYAKTISFNMNEKFSISSPNSDYDTKEEAASSDYFKLQPYDLVSIRPDPYFNYQKQVKISGEVLYPGTYVILSSQEKITDIIDRAGGLRPNAYPMASIFIRNGIKINTSFKDIINNPKSNLNFNVQEGDEIVVGRNPNIVILKGQVNSPGVYKYVPKKRLKYYLLSSGGLSPNADLKNIWIEYPNGNSKKYNQYYFYKGPKVLDGSTIMIGAKKEEEPFDHTEYAKELTAILANLAQAITVVILAAR